MTSNIYYYQVLETGEFITISNERRNDHIVTCNFIAHRAQKFIFMEGETWVAHTNIYLNEDGTKEDLFGGLISVYDVKFKYYA